MAQPSRPASPPPCPAACWLAACAVLAALPLTAQTTAASPLLESRHIADIAPGPGNPRNSEGAFIGLRDGGILFVYSRYLGEGYRDFSYAGLAARVSADQGETWSEDRVLVRPEEHAGLVPGQPSNVMSVSLLRMANGDIGLFYLLRRSWYDMRLQLRRSADEGATWSEPLQCFPVQGCYVVNNDRVVRLASGRIIIPTALHRQRQDLADWPEEMLHTMAPWRQAVIDNRAIAIFFVSDDDGHSWRETPGYVTLPSPHTNTGLQEPGLVQLPNGMLWGWARTDLGRQYEFFSWDEGETWTQAGPSRFTSPASPLSMKQIPGTDQLLAIWNPAPAYETRPVKRTGGDRTPFVGAIGRGTGKDWGRAFLIEGDDEVDAGYHYTAIHFLDDAVLLGYCAGNSEDRHRLNRLRIRKIRIAPGD
jgi:hypothetical protein